MQHYQYHNNHNYFTDPHFSQLLSQCFDVAKQAIGKDFILVNDKVRKATSKLEEQRKNKVKSQQMNIDDDYEQEGVLKEYGFLFGISGEDDLEALREAKNKKVSDLPQSRLPVPEVRKILEEGEKFVEIFGDAIVAKLADNVNSRHDHSTKYFGVTTKIDSAPISTISTLTTTKGCINNNNNNNIFLKTLAKHIQTAPSRFPALFEHFVPNLRDILTNIVALACFADCNGTNILVLENNNNIAPATTNFDNNPNNTSLSNNASNISGAGKPPPSSSIASVDVSQFINAPIRKAAQAQIFAVALEGRRIAHTCPATLVEMAQSKEHSHRLADAIVREFERGYRRMVQDERNRLSTENQERENNHSDDDDNNNSEVQDQETNEDSAVPTSAMKEGGDNICDNTPKDYSTDALQAVWSAFQYEQEKYAASSTPEVATRLAAQWLLFARMFIAPRLLSWVSAVIDPLTFSANNNTAAAAMKTTTSLDAAAAGAVDFYYDSQSHDENVWVTFHKLYENLLVPSMSDKVIDCDSVRTILYRILLFFEGKLRRTNQLVKNAASNNRTSRSGNLHEQTKQESQATSTNISALTNWANFANSNTHNSTTNQNSSSTSAMNKNSVASSGSGTSMSDLIEAAVSRRCGGAAVNEATFTTPEGHVIHIAEGGSLTQPFQFYVKDQVQIFAKKGKLKSFSVFTRILSIDDLIKFANSK